jgi:hypothetical protein
MVTTCAVLKAFRFKQLRKRKIPRTFKFLAILDENPLFLM